MVNRAQEQGVEPPTIVRNVIDFLFLYGHFVRCNDILIVIGAHNRPVKTSMRTRTRTRRKRMSSICPPLLLKRATELEHRSGAQEEHWQGVKAPLVNGRRYWVAGV